MSGEREAWRELQRVMNEGPSDESLAQMNETVRRVREQIEVATAEFHRRMRPAFEQARRIDWPPPTTPTTAPRLRGPEAETEEA